MNVNYGEDNFEIYVFKAKALEPTILILSLCLKVLALANSTKMRIQAILIQQIMVKAIFHRFWNLKFEHLFFKAKAPEPTILILSLCLKFLALANSTKMRIQAILIQRIMVKTIFFCFKTFPKNIHFSNLRLLKT
jgi:hypothetical protein